MPADATNTNFTTPAQLPDSADGELRDIHSDNAGQQGMDSYIVPVLRKRNAIKAHSTAVVHSFVSCV